REQGPPERRARSGSFLLVAVEMLDDVGEDSMAHVTPDERVEMRIVRQDTKRVVLRTVVAFEPSQGLLGPLGMEDVVALSRQEMDRHVAQQVRSLEIAVAPMRVDSPTLL